MLHCLNTGFLASGSVSKEREVCKLGRSLTALALAHFRCPLRSSSGIVEEQAEDLGLDERDFAAVHVRVDKRAVVLAAIPSRIWHSSDAMALLHELKARCSLLGEHVVLVPEGFIGRQPRLDNAMLLRGARDVIMPISDRMSVLQHLIENGNSSIMELATCIRHPDPISAIMGMVTSGLLDMDLDRPIAPYSVVSMAGAR